MVTERKRAREGGGRREGERERHRAKEKGGERGEENLPEPSSLGSGT